VIPGLVDSDHVGFVVPNLEDAAGFFVDLVGAEVLFWLGPFRRQEGEPDWMWEQLRVPSDATLRAVLLRLGSGLGLELYEIREAADQRSDHVRAYDIGGPHLAFRVGDLDAAYAYLREREDVTLHGEPQAPEDGPLTGMRWLHFETPWGLVLEIDEWPQNPYGRPDQGDEA
jgi:catechol 2,3-dioxygenase-like lactoylglutathione lyase family enzyme